MGEVLILVQGSVCKLWVLESLLDCLLHWKLFGLFLSCRVILDIRIALQSQKFPSKAHSHARIRVLCNSAHQQRKESKYLLAILF